MSESELYKGFAIRPVPKACPKGIWSVEIHVSIPGDARASATIYSPDATFDDRDLALNEGFAFARANIDARYPLA